MSDSVASTSVPADIRRIQATRRGPVRPPKDLGWRAFSGTRLRCSDRHRHAHPTRSAVRAALRRCLGRDRCQVRLYQARGPHSRILDEVSLEYLATGPIAFDRLRQQMREQQLDRYPVIVGLGGANSARVATLATPSDRNDYPGQLPYGLRVIRAVTGRLRRPFPRALIEGAGWDESRPGLR